MKGHCVVVIAEGAEDGMIPEERDAMREKLGMKKDEVRKDESGNIKNVVSLKVVIHDCRHCLGYWQFYQG